ncbi:DNA modification methylase [Mycobacteroides abscessus subsp. abscessus]|uniref:DNA-methyltransferase n=1 Tax=Mycobacteroides abscessus TaxID=36809 RepID=UPI0009A8FFF7|nr:site-specific DNA-methyltransferase [Mycobacteroides abscessus]SLJ67508.1 DNA modification methylase [Mycobacteroides abscessus subsp. abscessus]
MSNLSPYYQDSSITLYHGDWRDVLPHLDSVDVTITDPPYSARVHSVVRSREMGRRDRGAGGAASARVVDLGFSCLTDEERLTVAKEFGRLTKRWVLTFSDIESIHSWRADMQAAGLQYVRTGAWVRENGAPQFSGDRPAEGFEAITICHRPGRKRWNGGGRRAVWSVPVVIDRGHNGARLHPTQKPDALMRSLVELFSEPGETILDPYAGSGSTLVAANYLGRKAIGVEKNELYCERTVTRLQQLVLAFSEEAGA